MTTNNRHRGRAYGYTITRAAEDRGDGRESWNVACACGWWHWNQPSRYAAELALEQHRSADSRHRKPCLVGRDAA